MKTTTHELALDLPAAASAPAPVAYPVTNLRLVASVQEDTAAPAHVETAADAVAYMAGAFDNFPDQEQIWIVLLNRKNRAIGRQLCTVGTVSSCQGTAATIFRAAILASAAAVIIFHNHPSGDPSPSAQDMAFTRKIREAARTIEIELHDHIIIGRPVTDPAGLGYFSFRTAGLL